MIFFQDEFEGCHAVLLNDDVALTTAQCIQEHGGDPEPIFVVPGMYDERKYRDNQNPRLANENFKYVEFKNVDNHQKIYSDLALLRLKSPMNSQVFPALQIANFIPIPEGKLSKSQNSIKSSILRNHKKSQNSSNVEEIAKIINFTKFEKNR